MNPARRAWLGVLAAGALGDTSRAAAPSAPSVAGSAPSAIRRGTVLAFPRDHGAHVEARTEWWYITGWLAPPAQARTPAPTPTHGFQVTFFRSRLPAADAAAGSASTTISRFAPRQLLFAHAAVTDLAAARHHHAQRIARWNGDPGSGPDRAALADADVRLDRWHLRHERAGDGGGGSSAHSDRAATIASRWLTEVTTDAFALRASMLATQPPLLQGDAGFSRKGPDESQASLYVSLPQLETDLTLELSGQPRLALQGRAWLDHEWSDHLLHPQAVGWDWIGINLFDGSALTAFQLRRADGRALWAGGSLRGFTGVGAQGVPGLSSRSFAAEEVQFDPGRRWRSAATNASYAIEWKVRTPAGLHTVRALLDAQELAGGGGTGAVYWEGLVELLDDGGRRVGLGYLEMTGYAAPLKMG